MYVSMNVCMYISLSIYIYMYVCTYICICIYIWCGADYKGFLIFFLNSNIHINTHRQRDAIARGAANATQIFKI